MATIETAADVTFEIADALAGRYLVAIEDGGNLRVTFDSDRSIQVDVRQIQFLGTAMVYPSDSWFPLSRPTPRDLRPAAAVRAVLAQMAAWETDAR